MTNPIELMPVWLVGPAVFVLFFAANRAGVWARSARDLSVDAFFATSAAISLLALLIGFTFSVSLERYDARRTLVIEEAASIAQLWNRAQLEPEPIRGEVSTLVRSYVDERLRYFQFGTAPDRRLAADTAGDVIQARLWSIVRDLTETNTAPVATAGISASLTRVNDAGWRREAAARDYIPGAVIYILIIFATVTAWIIGYTTAARRDVHRLPNTAFFALLAGTIVLVVDLDQPRSGLVKVSEQSMLDLRADLARTSPAFAG